MSKEVVKLGEFYWHFKRNWQGDWNNYLYQVLNIGNHTENGEVLVVYRPMYVGPFGTEWACRPLSMFTDFVERDGKRMKRFTLVTDEKLIKKCKEMISGEKNEK